jgi:trehalose/maltose hydrolase-like predicted phosphorylase/beta-phosphoglucomutase-like phosphatase (HAD superfamily)
VVVDKQNDEVVTPMRLTGGIFDVDGVLLDTPHARAWRDALAQLMAGPWRALEPNTTYRPDAFTEAVYEDCISGKPRKAGAAAALEYFQLRDPDGSLAQQYGQVKQSILERLAAEGDFRAYDDAIRFLLQLKAAGMRLCSASSSKNANGFLKATAVGAFCEREGLNYPFVNAQTTLLDLFDANVNGLDVPRGKPDPALFLAAAGALAMPPDRCFVAEDAAVGIEAATSAGMFAIGVARHEDANLLRAAGAGIVVERLDAIDVRALTIDAPTHRSAILQQPKLPSGEDQTWSRRMLQPTSDPRWRLFAPPYDRKVEGQIESELALGNGFMGMRAVLPFATPGGQRRAYVAGLFGDPPDPVVTPVLYSAPIWLNLKLTIDGEEVTPQSGKLLHEDRTLDMRRGLLIESLVWRTHQGNVLRLQTGRLVSQAERALSLGYAEVLAEKSADVTLAASVSRDESSFPLELAERKEGADTWCTPQRLHWVAITHDAAVEVQGELLQPTITEEGMVWPWRASPGHVARFTQLAVIRRGDGEQGAETSRAAVRAARQSILEKGTAALLDAHVRAWEQRWTASDVVVEANPTAQRAMRFAIYHMISAADPEDDRVSVGARALTGMEYSGHVFWDTDLFLLPFYTYTWPEAARAMLLYRYHCLPGARDKAKQYGNRGAFYAWESADTGEEATPKGVIGPDGREVQYHVSTSAIHISADVAYAAWNYWQITGDDAFMRDAGAEILLETARFWASRAEPGTDGVYHLRAVIGPDEYHPDVDDNAYTNHLARWNLARAREAVEWMQVRWPRQWSALQRRLQLVDEELQDWREIGDKILKGFNPATGLLEQFAGYSQLEDIDLPFLEASITPPAASIDLVLGMERTSKTQIVKQADVVMLLALLWDSFTPEVRATNFAYYAPRCSQGSSLSPAIHALVAARLGEMAHAEDYFRRAAEIDRRDVRRNTSLGVHIATQGGLWQAAVLGFAGLSAHPDGLRLDPHLPSQWPALQFAACWHGSRVRVRLQERTRTMTTVLEEGPTLVMGLGDQKRSLQPGVEWTAQW